MAAPPSLEAERLFLENSQEKRLLGRAYNFSILQEEKIVGAVGIIPDERHTHCAEIGYFVDRSYWGHGIAPQAVGLAESFARENLDTRRFEIVMAMENHASRRVAEKCGYHREGVLKMKLKLGESFHDAYLYVKIID